MTEVKNKVQYVAISTLKELKGNPRTITTARFEILKKSIASNPEFFEARPVLVNEVDGVRTVFAGNQRMKAAKALGMSEVPTVIYHNLTTKKQKELTIRDNIELGEWDMDILANEWDAKDLEDMGAPISSFDDEDLEDFFENTDGDKEEKSNTKEVTCPECGHKFEA